MEKIQKCRELKISKSGECETLEKSKKYQGIQKLRKIKRYCQELKNLEILKKGIQKNFENIWKCRDSKESGNHEKLRIWRDFVNLIPSKQEF